MGKGKGNFVLRQQRASEERMNDEPVSGWIFSCHHLSMQSISCRVLAHLPQSSSSSSAESLARELQSRAVSRAATNAAAAASGTAARRRGSEVALVHTDKCEADGADRQAKQKQKSEREALQSKEEHRRRRRRRRPNGCAARACAFISSSHCVSVSLLSSLVLPRVALIVLTTATVPAITAVAAARPAPLLQPRG